MGPYLRISYSFLAMTRQSQYIARHRHPGQEGDRLRVQPTGSKYLFVYPFVKKREWYRLTQEERQRMMNEHIRVGHKYPSVKINTSYSFGLDDQEFVLGFETDSPQDFLDLVMALRESEASMYTLRDTPIFTCIAMEPERMLETLGG
jgi:chlorite dismutase